MNRVTTITAAGLKQQLEGANPPLVIDIRDPFEWEEGYITERNIPLYEIPAMISDLEPWKQKIIVLYCKEGDRSEPVEVNPPTAETRYPTHPHGAGESHDVPARPAVGHQVKKLMRSRRAMNGS